MTITRILFAGLLLSLGATAQATVYKCVDAAGRVTYTNDQTLARSCKPLSTDQAVSTIPPPSVAPSSRSPVDFPRVGRNAQQERDQTRRMILENELLLEEQSLAQARAQVEEQTAALASKDESGPANSEVLKRYQDRVELHQRNVEALRREIGNLR